MATALLITIAIVVCWAVQSKVRGRWFRLFASIVATMIAWVAASFVFAWATQRPLVPAGQWSSLEAILIAALIAQCVAGVLAVKRRLMGEPAE